MDISIHCSDYRHLPDLKLFSWLERYPINIPRPVSGVILRDYYFFPLGLDYAKSQCSCSSPHWENSKETVTKTSMVSQTHFTGLGIWSETIFC